MEFLLFYFKLFFFLFWYITKTANTKKVKLLFFLNSDCCLDIISSGNFNQHLQIIHKAQPLSYNSICQQ